MTEHSTSDIIDGRNWNAEFYKDNNSDGLFLLELDNAKILVCPVAVGDFSEGSGIRVKQQAHYRIDGLSQDCRMKTVIPFGVEPEVRRNVLFADGEMRVLLDVAINSKAEFGRITLEPLVVEGDWQKVAVAPCPEPGMPFPEPEWQDISQDTIIYQDENPFLFCRLKDKAGHVIEIGNGDDLWRIGGASGLEGVTGQFSICVENGKIVISRIPYIFPPDYPCGNRSWRFKWYVCWAARERDHGGWEELKVDTAKLPDNIYAQDRDGKRCNGMICWYAAAWRKAFKKAVRSAASRKAKVFFHVGDPVFCGDPAHMERSRKAYMPHWDMMIRRELFLWARQQMKAAGGDFKAVYEAEKTINPE